MYHCFTRWYIRTVDCHCSTSQLRKISVTNCKYNTLIEDMVNIDGVFSSGHGVLEQTQNTKKISTE